MFETCLIRRTGCSRPGLRCIHNLPGGDAPQKSSGNTRAPTSHSHSILLGLIVASSPISFIAEICAVRTKNACRIGGPFSPRRRNRSSRSGSTHKLGRGLEFQDFRCLDPDWLAGLRISALARGAFADREGAEIADRVSAFLLRFLRAASTSPRTRSTVLFASALFMLPFLATFSMKAARLITHPFTSENYSEAKNI